MIAPTNTGISIGRLLRISRPRFWIYVLGPVIVYFAGNGTFLSLYQNISSYGATAYINDIILLIVILGYFTLPANLWIYGWNDLADGDTDQFNTKKGEYEENIHTKGQSYKKALKKQIRLWNIGYISFGFLLIIGTIIVRQILNIEESHRFGSLFTFLGELRSTGSSKRGNGIILILFSIIPLLPFLITSYLYSCKPLRAKAKPFIDGIMNILYIATPITLAILPFDYGTIPNMHSILFASIAGLFRCMAMHCYSAIPDIIPDAQAGLNTTAVYLGKQKALIYCGILYALAALLSYPILGVGSIIGGVIYLTMIIVSYRKQDIFGLYKIFPYINFAVGFGLFWWLILKA